MQPKTKYTLLTPLKQHLIKSMAAHFHDANQTAPLRVVTHATQTEPPSPTLIARCTRCSTIYHHTDWDLNSVRCLARTCQGRLVDAGRTRPALAAAFETAFSVRREALTRAGQAADLGAGPAGEVAL